MKTIKLLSLNQVEQALQTSVNVLESNGEQLYTTKEVLSLLKLIDNALIKQANRNLSDGFVLTSEKEEL